MPRSPTNRGGDAGSTSHAEVHPRPALSYSGGSGQGELVLIALGAGNYVVLQRQSWNSNAGSTVYFPRTGTNWLSVVRDICHDIAVRLNLRRPSHSSRFPVGFDTLVLGDYVGHFPRQEFQESVLITQSIFLIHSFIKTRLKITLSVKTYSQSRRTNFRNSSFDKTFHGSFCPHTLLYHTRCP